MITFIVLAEICKVLDVPAWTVTLCYVGLGIKVAGIFLKATVETFKETIEKYADLK